MAPSKMPENIAPEWTPGVRNVSKPVVTNEHVERTQDQAEKNLRANEVKVVKNSPTLRRSLLKEQHLQKNKSVVELKTLAIKTRTPVSKASVDSKDDSDILMSTPGLHLTPSEKQPLRKCKSVTELRTPSVASDPVQTTSQSGAVELSVPVQDGHGTIQHLKVRMPAFNFEAFRMVVLQLCYYDDWRQRLERNIEVILKLKLDDADVAAGVPAYWANLSQHEQDSKHINLWLHLEHMEGISKNHARLCEVLVRNLNLITTKSDELVQILDARWDDYVEPEIRGELGELKGGKVVLHEEWRTEFAMKFRYGPREERRYTSDQLREWRTSWHWKDDSQDKEASQEEVASQLSAPQQWKHPQQ